MNYSSALIYIFLYRVIHALVQARSGEKVQTFGYRTPMAADCVGIETDEIGEVTAYLKRNFSK